MNFKIFISLIITILFILSAGNVFAVPGDTTPPDLTAEILSELVTGGKVTRPFTVGGFVHDPSGIIRIEYLLTSDHTNPLRYPIFDEDENTWSITIDYYVSPHANNKGVIAYDDSEMINSTGNSVKLSIFPSDSYPEPDDMPPNTMTVSTPLNDPLTELSFEGTVADDNPGVRVLVRYHEIKMYTIPGESENLTRFIRNLGYATVDTSVNPHTWTFSDSSVDDLNGYYTLEFIAIDSNRNTTFADINGEVTIDTTPDTEGPTVTLDSPSDGSTETTNNIVFSGTAADSKSGMQKVELYDSNGLIESTTSFNGDNWEITVNLQDGNYEVYAKAYDNEDNTADSSTIEITVNTSDQTPPSITLENPQDGNTFATTDINFQGTAEDNESGIEKVEIYREGDSNALATVTSFTGNAWSTVISMSEGDHNVFAKAYNNENLTTDTAVITFNITIPVDNPPTIDVNSPDENHIFTTSTITVTGTSSDDNNVEEVKVADVYDANNPILLGNAVLNGTDWSYSESGLQDGTYTFSFTAVDDTNKESTPEVLTVYVDTENPEVTLDSPADESILTQHMFTVQGTMSDLGSGKQKVEIYETQQDLGLIGGTSNFSGDNWETTLELPEGSYTIYARAYDVSGKTTDSNAHDFNVEVTPGIIINDGNAYAKDQNLEVDVTPPYMATQMYLRCLNSESGETYELPITNPLVVDINQMEDCPLEGIVVLEAMFDSPMQQEGDGEEPETPQIYDDNIHVDLTNPTVSITEPTDGSTSSSSSFTIKADVEDLNGDSEDGPSGISSVNVKINGDEYSMTAGSNNEWTYNASSLANGSYTIEVIAEDNAGNSGSDSISVTVNVPAPPAPPGGGGGGFTGGGGGIPQTNNDQNSSDTNSTNDNTNDTNSSNNDTNSTPQVTNNNPVEELPLARTGNTEQPEPEVANPPEQPVNPPTTGLFGLDFTGTLGLIIGLLIALGIMSYGGYRYYIKKRDEEE